MRQRSFWGWGWEDERLSSERQQGLTQLLAARFGLSELTVRPPPGLDEITLRAPRVSAPAHLAALCSSDKRDRAAHSYGKSFRDIVRALRRDFSNPPDLVVRPQHEEDLAAVLDWCSAARIVAIPFGGGSSVVGGVEPPGDAKAVVSIDMEHLNRVLEIDTVSRAARIQAGIYGPALEDSLRPHGYTLRHFPQSFEFSTLGGWIATRSGGHFATLHTHIDDFVEALRTLTPSGIVESRRLPGSGAGPSPDRLFIGSEGILGIITEAWVRLQDRPTFRHSAALSFATFQQGVAAVRALAQSGLHPTNCRLLDPLEAMTSGAGSGAEAVLIVAFESADHPCDAWMERALQCCGDHGAAIPGHVSTRPSDARSGSDDAAGRWRQSFLQAPYLRDALATMGMISETFETAVTWDRFDSFHQGILAAVNKTLERVCGGGQVSCRFTHVYPDGAAPYYTVIAPSHHDRQLEDWTEIKSAAADAILANGGTITHHHAVGRDHRPWYDHQCPPGFARVLRAAKRELDPAGILNPGVLIDSQAAR